MTATLVPARAAVSTPTTVIGKAGPRVGARGRSVPFGEAVRFWLKLGFINFGGPAGPIAIMHRSLVEDKRWVSDNLFLRALNFCMLLPLFGTRRSRPNFCRQIGPRSSADKPLFGTR